jgi:phytoene/squalene synthetase
MTEAADLASGKGHKDENFPVASLLLRPAHRRPILAFYRFARAADDIADNPDASADAKLHLLARMRAGLDGEGAPEAMALREVMAERRVDPVHAHELLDAFVRDVTVRRYRDWNELIAYCRLSAMPVGRYVLDVHGESRETWRANDALCSALQIINHLQGLSAARSNLHPARYGREGRGVGRRPRDAGAPRHSYRSRAANARPA